MDLKKFIQEEVQKLHKISLLKEEKTKVEKALKLIKESKEDLIDYDIPEWALSALVNGDYSGLNDEEEQKLKQFLAKVSAEYGNAGFLLGDIEGEDNLGFKYRNDIDSLGSNVYRLYIKPDKPLGETKDVTAMYKKAGMEAPHPGKGIHTKKFHKCVTSVGDEGGKNPYAICMSSLGKDKAVHKSHQTEGKIDEVKKPIAPISEKTKTILAKFILEKGAKETAIQLINKLSQTGMVSDFPDSMEYGQGVNRIEALLLKGDLDQAVHSAKNLAKKLEKKAMKDFGF